MAKRKLSSSNQCVNDKTLSDKRNLSKKKFEKLSVIIPTFNEGKTITLVLEKVIAANLPNDIQKEIIIIDDCSVDDTKEKVDKMINLHPSVHIKYTKLNTNRGKGYAVRMGIKSATGDIIIIQDADLEYEPNDYSSLMHPILSGEHKVVYGSRSMNKSNKYSYQTYYWGGRFLSYITSVLYGQKITDEPTCYKMFDASLLKSIPLTSDRFGFCPEVTAKVLRMGYKIVEIPILYYPRSKTEGKKIKLRDGIEAIYILCKFRLQNKWLKAPNIMIEQENNANKVSLVAHSKWLMKNTACLVVSLFLLAITFSKQPAYNWVYFDLLKSNMETIKEFRELTFDEKMLMKLGVSFEYLLFLKQSTPENAVILYPSPEAFHIENSPFTENIDNKIYATRFLYPRKLILESDLAKSKYASKITHIAVVNGKGLENIPYPTDSTLEHGVFPVETQPNN